MFLIKATVRLPLRLQPHRSDPWSLFRNWSLSLCL